MIADDSFLAAILAAPDDDTPRLVYADWLEESGNPRGEFIRLQCALAGNSVDVQTRSAGMLREQELLKLHEAEWASAIRPLVEAYRFRRGFVEDVQLPLRRFADNLDAIFAAAPVRVAHLDYGQHGRDRPDLANYRRLAAAPELGRLIGLDLALPMAEDTLRVLLGSPHLNNLTFLALGDDEDLAAAARTITASPNLRSLTELYIGGDPVEAETGDEGLRTLAQTPHLAGLKVLNLNNNGIGPAGAEALANSPYLSHIRDLHLGHGSYSPNQIGAAGLVAIAGSPNFRGLMELSLPFNGVEDDGLAAVASSPHLGALQTLFLVANGITGRGVESLAGSRNLTTVTSLALNGNNIGDGGAVALANSPFATRLESLRLSRCGIASEGVRAIASSAGLPVLRELDLSDSQLDATAVSALLDSPLVERIESLSLRESSLSPEWQRALRDRYADRVRF